MQINTIKEKLYWSYANLAMSHAALTQKAVKFTQIHYMIRSKMFKGLMNGTMNIGALYEDEKLKMIIPQTCCYCGSNDNLSIDHLIPRKKGGADNGENFVWACKSCNSSKNAKDMLEWLESKNQFPSIYLMRRYLKLAINISEEMGILEYEIANAPNLPFSINSIPEKYPKPCLQHFWITQA
jgi:HNH endonuclease